MTWSKNNSACVQTWIALRTMGLTEAAFPEASQQKMSELGHWNKDDGLKVRKLKSRAIANNLHFFYRSVPKASGEEGISESDAIMSSTKVLADESKTIEDLAASVDANYRCLDEV
jgi:hypothetical protein